MKNKTCIPYQVDMKLLNKLGPPSWEAKSLNEEIYIGEVFP
jgi:hypothetical protein